MASIGQAAGSKPISVESEPYNASLPDRLRDANLIYVGSTTDFPDWRKQVQWPLGISAADELTTPDGSIVDPDTGAVMEARSPLNAGRVALAVTGRTGLAIHKAATALTQGPGPAWAGQSYVLTPEEGAPSATASQSINAGAITFADLGLSDQTLSSAGPRSLTFTGQFPSLTDGLTLHLLTTIAPPSRDGAADAFRVRLDVNGSPTATVAMDSRVGDSATATVNIPGNALRAGLNTFDLTFTLPYRPATPAPLPVPQASGQRPCGAVPQPPLQASSIVVHNSSNLQITPGNVSHAVDLADYPYPFNTDNRIDATTVILPSRPFDVGPYLRFAADLGRSVQGTMSVPSVVLTDGTDPKDIDANVIVWGTADQNDALPLLDGSLPLAVGTGLPRRFTFTNGLSMSVSAGVVVAGIIEELPSSVSGRQILVVSGTTPEGIPLAVSGFVQRSLSGNCDIVTPAPPSDRPRATFLPAQVVARPLAQ